MAATVLVPGLRTKFPYDGGPPQVICDGVSVDTSLGAAPFHCSAYAVRPWSATTMSGFWSGSKSMAGVSWSSAW